MALKDLDKGDKVDIHVQIATRKLDIIDTLRARYNCSRAAVIEAWADEYAGLDLTGKVIEGRRPGGGRKKKPRPHPFAEWAHLVPELVKKDP